jgi:tetratricopeptide (TPR) repeat protein
MYKKIIITVCIFVLSYTSLYAKKVIGVTAFKNLSRDKALAWLEVGIAETVSYKLRNVKEYIIVDRTNVEKAINEIALSQTGIIDDKSAKKAGKALGADIIIVGNFQKYGKNIRITAKLLDVESHEVLKQVQSTGLLDNIFDLQDNIALAIIDKTNTSISKEEKKQITAKQTENLSAYEYYIKGQTFILKELQYRKAIDMFKKAIAIDKNYSLAYAGLGKAYSLRNWELRNYANKIDPSLLENSFKYSKKAISINPDLDEAYVSLARYYQEADEKKVPNKWNLVEKYAKKALKKNQNNGEAYFVLSRRFGYDDVKETQYLELALTKNPFLTDAHNNMGVIYLNQGKLKLAEQSFKKTIELDPGFKTAYMNLGVVYDRLGLYENAIDMYKQVIDKYPNYSLGLLNLGIGYRRLQQYDRALEYFNRAVRAKKDYAAGWGEIGYIYLLKKEHKKAIQYFLKSLRYDKKYKYSLANIGYCYAELGQYQNAITYLTQAANYYPDYAWPANKLGLIYYYNLKNKKQAEFWFRKAIKREPNNKTYQDNLNRVLSNK